MYHEQWGVIRHDFISSSFVIRDDFIRSSLPTFIYASRQNSNMKDIFVLQYQMHVRIISLYLFSDIIQFNR